MPPNFASNTKQIKHIMISGGIEVFYFMTLLSMGFNCLRTTEPLRGDSLLFTTKFPGGPGNSLNIKQEIFVEHLMNTSDDHTFCDRLTSLEGFSLPHKSLPL